MAAASRGPTCATYPHDDWQALEKLLARPAAAPPPVIVTDRIFSMDGDLAPLAELADVADRHGAMPSVDEGARNRRFRREAAGVWPSSWAWRSAFPSA